jgi:hypothetical protein
MEGGDGQWGGGGEEEKEAKRRFLIESGIHHSTHLKY